DGAAALVEPRFEHGAERRLLGVGLGLLHVGHEQQHLEQLLEPHLLLRRDVDEDVGSAPLRGRRPAGGSALSSAICVFAETLTKTLVPPHSSGFSPRSESCWRTRSGCASGLSILFTATTIGNPAAFAWSIASSRC